MRCGFWILQHCDCAESKTMENLLLFLLILGYCSGRINYTEQVQNYVKLISLYSVDNVSTVDFIPRNDLSQPLNVTVDMILHALNDFDEVAGNVELVGVLNMSWTDEIILANNAPDFIYDVNKTSFVVPNNKIWTPRLVLSNAVDGVSAVGNPAYMCRFYMDTFLVEWAPRILIRGACSPDVTYYPFDRQSCVFTYIPWGFQRDEILLFNNRGSWDMSSYEENGEWSVIETKTETFVIDRTSNLKLSLTIERKPLYFAFNIILPVLVLCILNSMVFWLPAASGERVGFSITCFLSFVVLLNLVFDILPRSSSPISYLCYYLVVMMVFSGLVTAFVIIEMNAFHKPEDEKVPDWLQCLIKIVTFRWCCNCTHNNVSDVDSQTTSHGSHSNLVKDVKDKKLDKRVSQTSSEMKRPQSQPKARNEITWVMVGNLLDKLFFIAFLAGQIFFSVTFLLPLGFRL